MISLSKDFDLLTLTATELQGFLERKEITSELLVDLCLSQIQKHNREGMMLNAIIATVPKDQALEAARKLDEERAQKGPRGPMHGIPIIVKDTLCSPTLGVDTTCGSFALKGAKAKKNAAVLDALLRAGMIILAKTNLSEFGGMKQALMTGGWSAVGGQTQSPYVRGGVQPNCTFLGHSTPAGSSAGSAAGVAAGFAPVSIGTESDGSLVQPATRASLYGMKATLHTLDTFGIQPISPEFDSAGGMAKTVEDLAKTMDLLQEGKDYTSHLTSFFKGLRLGFVDPELWKAADFVVEPNKDFDVQNLAAMNAAISKIRDAGARVVQPVKLVTLEETMEEGGEDIDELMDHDFKVSLKEYLSNFENPSNVYGLEDLIDYNKEHADLELPPEHPNQDVLIGALNSNMTDQQCKERLAITRHRATSAIKKSLAENEIDVILGPADSRIASVAAAAGFPVATVPLGLADFNGRAFGMLLISPENTEAKMFEVMSAWEATLGLGNHLQCS
ncbi:MAG: hypothetical protein L6R42_005531 [Xanthoria sp. 1 TBL-2021]|nr:MAG: hypothetical protein L6R42_005531 [Xanthoria sp. 1 TBL-2021]